MGVYSAHTPSEKYVLTRPRLLSNYASLLFFIHRGGYRKKFFTNIFHFRFLPSPYTFLVDVFVLHTKLIIFLSSPHKQILLTEENNELFNMTCKAPTVQSSLLPTSLIISNTNLIHLPDLIIHLIYHVFTYAHSFLFIHILYICLLYARNFARCQRLNFFINAQACLYLHRMSPIYKGRANGDKI